MAISCYKGPLQNASECASVTNQYLNNSFQQTFPVGNSYPLQPNCPLIPFGEEADSRCGLGDSPVYTVNATEIEHIQSAVAWARSTNIRLVIRNTGHDLLGRSMGYGSLQIWIKHLRQGIEYHARIEQGSHQKSTTSWKGPAFTIRGGYTWSDVIFACFVALRSIFRLLLSIHSSASVSLLSAIGIALPHRAAIVDSISFSNVSWLEHRATDLAEATRSFLRAMIVPMTRQA